MILTSEQNTAIERILAWLDTDNPQEFKLGGYAGTGKTTIIRTLLEQLYCDVEVCAFTGKACHVLQRKGIESQTIHSLVYITHKDPSTGEMWFERRQNLVTQPGLIIVDEASMLSVELYNDLRSYGIPCLFVGDPGQLEPVGDNPNLMKLPDYTLQTIHRQAASNPILAFAQAVRTGQRITYHPDDGRLWAGSDTLNTANLIKADQVICARNKTRTRLNQSFRKYLGYAQQGMLVPGDKVICLRNNKLLGVFNGMLFRVKEVKEKERGWTWNCLMEDELGNLHTLPVWQRPFLRPEEPVKEVPAKVVYMDYAYVITCHKAQGSEWQNVHVIDEYMPPNVWDMKRWRYTAITRAAERLVYTI